MPIGDDFYQYHIEFSNGDERVAVGMNATFVREVLHCDGDKAAMEACVEGNRDRLIEEALEHRKEWFTIHSGVRVCMLGLSGIPQFDKGKSFARLGWPSGVAHEDRGTN